MTTGEPTRLIQILEDGFKVLECIMQRLFKPFRHSIDPGTEVGLSIGQVITKKWDRVLSCNSNRRSTT
ncbi:hypothetical protein ACKFKG_26675 [Phormidesmis sp. 146-35]